MCEGSGSQPEGLTKFDGDSTTVTPSEIWSLNYDDDGVYLIQIPYEQLFDCSGYIATQCLYLMGDIGLTLTTSESVQCIEGNCNLVLQ